MLHGGNIYGFSEEMQTKLLDFSANISPLGMPQKVRDAIIGELDHALHYPDPEANRLRYAIAQKYHIPYQQIICGNGAADIIYRFVYAKKPARALVIHPTFVEYEEAMACVGTQIIGYDLKHEDFMIREDILEVMDASMDVMFICNPNNPTGVLTSKALLLRILEKARQCGIFLVLDECFLDFSEDEDAYSCIGSLMDYENLLILKSFTKMYAIPGVRIGYGLSSNVSLLQAMQHSGQSWSVSTMAVSAAIAALSEEAYAARVRAYIENERMYMTETLKTLGISYVEGHANYILIHVPFVPDLYEQLLKRQMMIRTCSNYSNLDGSYYRIAINRHEDNVCLMKALSEVLSEHKL